MPGAVAHSHRPTVKSLNKSFKSRKNTKNAIRDSAKGKTQNERRKTPHQQVMSKLDRRNQNRQRQLEKQKEIKQSASIFSGRGGAPRIVAVIPLCGSCNAVAAVKALNASLDIDDDITSGCSRVSVERFKQTLQFFAPDRHLESCLDAARVADFVVIALSASEEVDELGELILRSVESQGLSTLFTVVDGLDLIESVKQKVSVLESLKSYMKHFHPGQEKLYSLNNRQECSNLMRSLCITAPKGVVWRDERSWMSVENVKVNTVDGEETTVLTGVVRGKPLKADRLVHVGDCGPFEIRKITAAPLPTAKQATDGTSSDETEIVLELPGEDRDGLADVAPEEIVMTDVEVGDGAGHEVVNPEASKKGVLLDDHHYFSDEDADDLPRPKKLPKGTSSYQAAWYLDDDLSDSASDLEDVEMEDSVPLESSKDPADGIPAGDGDIETDAAPSEYPHTDRFEELNETEDAEQLAAFRANKRDEADEDMEFPDEIELQPNVLARERLARYRGLKGLRSSPWNMDEDRPWEPEEWRRLLQIPDYQSSRNRCTREALVGGVAPGTRVAVYLRDVPRQVAESFDASRPVTLFSLLRHEHKRTVANFLINLSSECPRSIKAKEELIMQCGPRRFVINPLFSQSGNTENNVHKYCRYLHPGQSAIATVMGPVTWGPVPVLFFWRSSPDAGGDEDKESSLPLRLVATGTALPPSTSRVIAKRVILTGHPYHIHKKVVTIRYMFFNREDVEWFKALPLWTKRGRSGYIRESLGTHGYFKATFDGRVNPQDSIGVSLYKRVFPRNATLFQGGMLDSPVPGDASEVQMDEN